MSCDPHAVASNVTESDVRIMVPVHNAVSITFVLDIWVYPKLILNSPGAP